MIELRRPVESAAGDAIASSLRDLVVAFRQIEDDQLLVPFFLSIQHHNHLRTQPT